MFFTIQPGNEDVIHSYNGILLNYKEKGIIEFGDAWEA